MLTAVQLIDSDPYAPQEAAQVNLVANGNTDISNESSNIRGHRIGVGVLH